VQPAFCCTKAYLTIYLYPLSAGYVVLDQHWAGYLETLFAIELRSFPPSVQRNAVEIIGAVVNCEEREDISLLRRKNHQHVVEQELHVFHEKQQQFRPYNEKEISKQQQQQRIKSQFSERAVELAQRKLQQQPVSQQPIPKHLQQKKHSNIQQQSEINLQQSSYPDLEQIDLYSLEREQGQLQLQQQIQQFQQQQLQRGNSYLGPQHQKQYEYLGRALMTLRMSFSGGPADIGHPSAGGKSSLLCENPFAVIRDLVNPSLNNSLKQQQQVTFKLVKTGKTIVETAYERSHD
jgi:hypothetical protein